MPSTQRTREVRIAPHINQVFDATGRLRGWRVYLRTNGVLKTYRFKADEATLPKLSVFIQRLQREADKSRAEARQQKYAPLRREALDVLRQGRDRLAYIDSQLGRKRRSGVSASAPRRPPAVTIGQKVDRLRRARGWTQEQLAERATLKVAAVQRNIKGRARPRPSTLRAYAAAFGITVAELLAT